MKLWMNRAGSRGEWEQKFLKDKRVYLQWKELDLDLSQIADKDGLRSLLRITYPEAPRQRIASYLGQIWIFVKEMQSGDWGWAAEQGDPSDSLR
jgi:restriction system protein